MRVRCISEAGAIEMGEINSFPSKRTRPDDPAIMPAQMKPSEVCATE